MQIPRPPTQHGPPSRGYKVGTNRLNKICRTPRDTAVGCRLTAPICIPWASRQFHRLLDLLSLLVTGSLRGRVGARGTGPPSPLSFRVICAAAPSPRDPQADGAKLWPDEMPTDFRFVRESFCRCVCLFVIAMLRYKVNTILFCAKYVRHRFIQGVSIEVLKAEI